MKKIFIYLIPFLWIVALFLPAYIFPPSYHDNKEVMYRGFMCLIFGWADGHVTIFGAWFANIPFLISYLMFLSKNPIKKFSVLLSAFAFCLSLLALTINTLILDEAGNTSATYPSIGAFVWIGSILLLLIGNIAVYRLQKN